MKRRKFLGAAGAYATLIRPQAEAQAVATKQKRARIDLNGAWDQSIDGHFVRTVQVPSSTHPLGRYDLSREFVLPRLAPDEHAILHFEAVALFARAFSNGTELGSLLPYVPHEFDISGAVRERSNTIRLNISDLTPGADGAGADEIALGINPGWRRTAASSARRGLSSAGHVHRKRSTAIHAGTRLSCRPLCGTRVSPVTRSRNGQSGSETFESRTDFRNRPSNVFHCRRRGGSRYRFRHRGSGLVVAGIAGPVRCRRFD